MNVFLHPAASRGGGDYEWLSTRHSFSFANWYEPSRMGFGALRVLNDDVIAPLQGFGTHGHRDMEIITIVMKGSVSHIDSMGNKYEIPAGDVQVMSAGTGVMHSEKNASNDEALALFQIWIEPNVQNSNPRYAQKSFDLVQTGPGLTLVVAPNESEGALSIQQDAYISYAVVDEENTATYRLRNPGHGVYVSVIEGNISVMGHTLFSRDAAGFTETDHLDLRAHTRASALLIEVPL